MRLTYAAAAALLTASFFVSDAGAVTVLFVLATVVFAAYAFFARSHRKRTQRRTRP
jgi:hypothetical protein